jgi:hypothetical protein
MMVSAPATSISVKDSCCACTPSRHSDRHVMAEDESMGTDDESTAKTMRRKAAINLDPAGNENCNAYLLAFTATNISVKLCSVGVSLGNNEK